MASILVIDDSPVQRAMARMMLEDAGHEVLEAGDGASGIAEAQSTSPDCVLLDLLLPDFSGCEVLRQLSAAGFNRPVLVLSADDPGELGQECLALGAKRVMQKPRDGDELVAAVAEVLANGQSEDV